MTGHIATHGNLRNGNRQGQLTPVKLYQRARHQACQIDAGFLRYFRVGQGVELHADFRDQLRRQARCQSSAFGIGDELDLAPVKEATVDIDAHQIASRQQVLPVESDFKANAPASLARLSVAA